MAKFIIEGGRRLSGSITPQGAKNEALEVLCAALLTDKPVTYRNVPEILDVHNLIGLMKDLGVEVTHPERGVYTLQCREVDTDFMDSASFIERMGQLRGTIMLVGALLSRTGRARLAKPGGDQIGRRRLDTHFLGFKKLGAEFDWESGDRACNIRVPVGGLRGCYMLLDEASVTGTANIILAAVSAKGPTTIYNAACEPYVRQLCKLLCDMGVKIEGIGSNLLTIHGVDDLLDGAEHRLLPDMIEVGSFIGMAAMTRSEVTIKNVSNPDLGLIPDTFRRMGIAVVQNEDDIIVPQQEHYEIESFIDGSIMTLADAPWPGLTPDLLSVMLVVATQAKGSVLIHQKMFESRLFFVDKLIDMGAQIILCDPHRAVVIGHDQRRRLQGRRMTSPDIRAGIALLIAALSAQGVSTISNIEQIDRGYQNIEERLKALGANITRE